MADPSQPVVQRDTSVAITPSGDRVIQSTTSTTAQTVVPLAPDTFWTKDHIGEIGSLVVALGTFVAYVEKKLEKRRKTETDALDNRLRPIEQKIETFKPKEQLSEERAAIEKQIGMVRHELAGDITNQAARLHLLEQGRSADVARIVILETNMSNLKEGQTRIENAVEKNHRETLDTLKGWAEQFSASIREIRDVRPRPER